MNTLKNVLFFGLLLAVLCLVYVVLNRSPESAPLPAGLTATTTPPKVEIPGLTGPPLSPVSSSPDFKGPPSFPPQPPTISDPPVRSGGTAPPFQPPTPVGLENIASPFPSGSNSGALTAPPPVTPTGPPGIPDPFRAGNASLSSPASSPPVALPPPPTENSSAVRIEQTMQQVKLDAEKNRFGNALLNLSQLYGNPDLPMSHAQMREVTKILDEMAGKVIYSREHWLVDPYLVQAGDTLDVIADRYHVPALLLARINGIRDPQNLPPGKELKVLKGPFSAYISTDRSEMTLMLEGRYAGRFSLVMSNDLAHATGFYAVRDKRPSTAAAGSAAGKQWMELSNASGAINVQGTNDTRVTTGRDSRSTIWLSEQDMDDVFGILSVGSRVIIQR